MGQKIHAKGYRIGVNIPWRSRWYAKGNEYTDKLHEDLKVRKFIKDRLQPAGVDSVVIKRPSNKIEIEVKVARPGVVIGRGGSGIEELKEELRKILNTKVDLTVSEVTNPDLSARIVARRIADAIEHRALPKIAVAKEVEKIKAAGAKGLKIWVSGCIGGAQIARTDKVEWGSIPLQTLRADIDFAREAPQTVGFGIHGIKVWIYKGEVSEIKNNKE